MSTFYRRALCVMTGTVVLFTASSSAEPLRFGRDVRPILSNACFKCHGPDEATRKAGLRLDTFEGATGGNAPSIVPGNPDASPLLARVVSHDPDERMPPLEVSKGLDDVSVATLRQWIAEGATYEPHWSFVPVQRPPLPPVKDAAWPRNAIDYFALSKMESAGLAPSPEADRRTLARRLYLDLTGLPPTPAEVEAFVNDTSAAAYEALVERLLASPHYGERWARIWLDLARYADTRGYEKDDRRVIWRYRDWVIDALNRDLPFDAFTAEQLAGDLLPNATTEQVLATAFHRNTMTNDEGGTDDEEFRTAAVIDRVNTTMSVWMGLTMACAQCHTHKYDPITQTEYYRFYALFNQTQDADLGTDEPLLTAPTPPQAERLEAIARAMEVETERLNHAIAQYAIAHPEWEQRFAAQAGAAVALGPWQEGRFEPASSHAEAFGPAALSPVDDASQRWTERPEYSDGVVNTLREGEAGATVLRRNITAPTSRMVKFWLGSNDGLRVVLNGREIHKNNIERTAAPDQDQIEATLAEGTNELLLRVSNAGGGHGFYFRLEDSSVSPELQAILGKPAESRSAEETATVRAHVAAGVAAFEPFRMRLEALRAERAALEKEVPKIPVLRELPEGQRRATHRFEAGSFLSPAEAVEPGVPAVFAGASGPMPQNRLELARWLCAPENPLTARVTVNRYWDAFFGHGIVATLEDFGTQGDWPTHPELIDWLAAEFMAQGWSMKELCRTIVTSSTYRQASHVTPLLREQDPNNQLYARGPRFRLDAETVRDQALRVAGLLEPTLYGPSVMPAQPEGVWQLVYSADKWTMSEGNDRYRRGLYTFWRRSAPYPSMIAFDAPSREVCTGKRIRTNTPLQAMVTLNDPVYVEAAQALARRMLREGGITAEARAQFGFTEATGRQPTPTELETLRALYASELAHYQQDPAAATTMACNPLGPLPEGLDAAEAAAWTVVGNVLLNLDEVLNKI